MLGFSSQLFSQACCSGGSPISANINLSKRDSVSFQTRFSYEYNFLNDLVNGSKKLANSNRNRINHAFIASLNVNLTKKSSITLLLPYITQIENIFDQGQVTFSRSASGISDILILGQYEVIKRKNSFIYFGLGVKLPNGKNDILRDNGILLAADLQPGTGSWDLLPVIQGYQNNIFKGFWDFSMSISYRITSNANRLNGTQKYQFGNELLIRTGLIKHLFLFEKLSKIGIIFSVRNTGYDKTNEFITPNTSGTWINIHPQFQYQISKQLNLLLRSEFPLWRNLKGTQLSTSYRLGFTLNYALH